MSDENLIERLRYNQVKYDNVGLAYAESRNPDGEEAAAAIERLTAECDVARAERDEQKRRADYLSKDFDRDIKMYQAEVAELRADLATTKAELAKTESDATWKISDLQHDLCDMRLRAEAAEAELAAVRELLKEARWVAIGAGDNAFAARIDAVLKGGA